MAKRLFMSDIEGDDLLDDITKIYCASYQELDPYMKEKGVLSTITTYEDINKMFSNPDNMIVMHNGLDYDGPAITKIIGIEVKAEIIDTLFLSWYLYPKRVKHGLAGWGEDLGIAKPEVSDWENLSLETYIHRCEEDVKIQTALWQQMWKHLILLYQKPADAWRLVRHLNFKGKCAALQRKSRWRLDTKKAVEAQEFFTKKYSEAIDALEQRLPEVPEYVKKNRPKKPFKMDGSLSAAGLKWEAIVKEYVDSDQIPKRPVDYMFEIKTIKGYKPPNAGSSAQIKNWLYSLGWVPETFEFKRNKTTNEVRQIPQVKKGSGLCPSVERLIRQEPDIQYLADMTVIKHRLDIVNGFLANVDDQGYIYATIQGLTNTLRFKHKVVLNLPSTRKPYGEVIRGMLIARSEKTELCGSDCSSLEDRTKQHYMWKYDPEYVKDMQTKGFDPHLDMCLEAGLLTQEESDWFKAHKDIDPNEMDEATYKEFGRISNIRHGGKGTNYSATYGAKGPTIARAAGVPEEIGNKLYDAYWTRNWSIKAIADNCIVKNSRGMKWLWNPVAKLWMYLKADKDRFSTLNQSTGTYAFDRWVWHMLEKRCQITGQMHDEVILELKIGNREAMTKILKDSIQAVNDELKLDRDLDVDVGFGRNYAQIH